MVKDGSRIQQPFTIGTYSICNGHGCIVLSVSAVLTSESCYQRIIHDVWAESEWARMIPYAHVRMDC